MKGLDFDKVKPFDVLYGECSIPHEEDFLDRIVIVQVKEVLSDKKFTYFNEIVIDPSEYGQEYYFNESPTELEYFMFINRYANIDEFDLLTTHSQYIKPTTKFKWNGEETIEVLNQ